MIGMYGLVRGGFGFYLSVMAKRSVAEKTDERERCFDWVERGWSERF